jgi:transcription initiation factor TFIID TATA-box-binding protein
MAELQDNSNNTTSTTSYTASSRNTNQVSNMNELTAEEVSQLAYVNANQSLAETSLENYKTSVVTIQNEATKDEYMGRFIHYSGIKPSITNLVATFQLNVKLDLKYLAMRARNAEYNPRKFQAIILRIRDPNVTASIFHTGKIVITGAHSEISAKLAGRKVSRMIQKLGYDNIRFSNFALQNIVATADCRFPIRLESLSSGEHEEMCNYEPELFPGLIYRMAAPKIVVLIFVSGKVVITGAKTRVDCYEAFELIYDILQSYRKDNVNNNLA